MVEFIREILNEVIAIIAVKFILFKGKKKWLGEHPNIKHQIDLGFYIFNKYVFCPALSIGFAINGVGVALFDPNYDTLPRFTAAWIAFGTGLTATILFRYINRNYHRPIRPV